MKRRNVKTSKLPAKKRKILVDKVKEKSFTGFEDEVLRLVENETIFKHFHHRFEILKVCLETPAVKQSVYALLKAMKEAYMDLLQKFCKGKKYLELQNSWFFHTNIYFDQSSHVSGITAAMSQQLFDSWQLIVQQVSKCGYEFTTNDQRLIAATLSSVFFKVMSQKVKDEKMVHELDHSASRSVPGGGGGGDSLVSQYRYSGFALHSMIEKRIKNASLAATTSHNITTNTARTAELNLLKAMKCKPKELQKVPSQYQDLSHGDLCIVSPKILPFVDALLKSISSHVTSEQLQTKGKAMMCAAKSAVLSDEDEPLFLVFKNCVKNIQMEDVTPAGEDETAQVALKCIFSEFKQKVFNCRANEFFKAKKELDLEKNEKVVDCAQSLRDSLKTYSSMKSR